MGKGESGEREGDDEKLYRKGGVSKALYIQ